MYCFLDERNYESFLNDNGDKERTKEMETEKNRKREESTLKICIERMADARRKGKKKTYKDKARKMGELRQIFH